MFYADWTACKSNIPGYIILYDYNCITLKVGCNHAVHLIFKGDLLVCDYNQPKYVWGQLIRGPVSTMTLQHSPGLTHAHEAQQVRAHEAQQFLPHHVNTIHILYMSYNNRIYTWPVDCLEAQSFRSTISALVRPNISSTYMYLVGQSPQVHWCI